MTTDIAALADGLTKAEWQCVMALCGNAWHGTGKVSPGLMLLNGLDLMELTVLKDQYGETIRYKANPTPLGQHVRAHLEAEAREGREI